MSSRAFITIDELVATATSPPLSPTLIALAARADLPLPAKLTAAGTDRDSLGAASVPLVSLMAEIPRDGTGRDAGAARTAAQAALGDALAYLGRPRLGASPDVAGGAGRRVDDATTAMSAAEAHGWSLTKIGEGHFRAAAGGAGTSTFELRTTGNGFVGISLGTRLLGPVGRPSAEAIVGFAREANARLRLARVGIEPMPAERLRMGWQAVVPVDGPLGPWLEEALCALVVARNETLAPLRALGADEVARSYLALRGVAVEAQPRSDRAA